MNGLNPQRIRFIKKLAQGYDQKDAAIAAGYSPRSAESQASQILKNAKVIEALDELGLSDKYLAKEIKTNIEAGSGIKATADTSLRGIELAYRLKGYLDKAPDTNLNQTNIYVNELKTLDDNELNNKLDQLLKDVELLKK